MILIDEYGKISVNNRIYICLTVWQEKYIIFLTDKVSYRLKGGIVIMKNSNEIIHPGQILAAILTKEDMSQKELSVRTGSTEKHISTIINGKKIFLLLLRKS